MVTANKEATEPKVHSGLVEVITFKVLWSKGQSESVYRRRTYNTMAKRKIQKDKQRSTKHYI
jgi:hypothetical protein